MTLFDRYVVVDWSASNRPKTGVDSIWIADLQTGRSPTVGNPSTRRDAERALVRIIESAGSARLLIAVDVALGYPAGSAAALGLPARWCAVWDEVARLLTDDERNCNNRFDVAASLNGRMGDGPGPFWGVPVRSRTPGLQPTKPAEWPIAEFRLHERRLRAAGQHPKSVWQLLGAGSVGGQTLTMLPLLRRVMTRFEPRIEVWPFTTGATAPITGPGGVVVVEVWPTQFERVVPPGMVKDAHQVTATAGALMAADLTGGLASWCSPPLDPVERTIVELEEGWVLGPPV